MKVYDTLRGALVEFNPKTPGEVGMYVCGVTVYDETHLGHARCYVAFDVIRRYLEYKGYKVKYVQNFTDIDDKIIARAHEEADNVEDVPRLVREIAERYTKSYFEVMDALNVKRADVYPRATEHIDDMIEIVRALCERGFAYEAEGSVYFDVRKFPGYGKLSKRSLDEMQAGARVEVEEGKRFGLDFALWKRAKEGEPFWESPWGHGRPGWHIECSAMSMKYLGATFDIHGGGQDLIFPHHENEIAQSEAYTGQEFVRYWLHNGFVTVNKEKMSKSLGNFFTLRDLYAKFHPQAIRLFLLSTHYRSPIDFSFQALEAAERARERLLECYSALLDAGVSPSKPDEDAMRQFQEAMDEDFNTAKAGGVVFATVNRINAALQKGKKEEIAHLAGAFIRMCDVLGIKLKKVEYQLLSPVEEMGYDVEEVNTLLARAEELTDSEIEYLLSIRDKARREKIWDLADRIREHLAPYIVLKDTKEGTYWRRRERQCL